MAFHGDNGWGADLANRNSVALDATSYDSGEPFEVLASKHHDGNRRYLQFVTPGGIKFLLTRDGIEDLKLFIEE